MSASFLLLLLTAAIVAYATAVTLRRKIPVAARIAAVALYLLLGIHTVMLAWWFGDGRLLPGFQLNPEIRNFYQAEAEKGAWPAPNPALSFFALLAHLIFVLPRPSRIAVAVLLPATLFFVGIFFYYFDQGALPATSYERGVGPGKNAYLTVAPDGDGFQLVLAVAEPDATLARVLGVYPSEMRPPATRLFWTKDGKGVVFVSRRRRLFAIDLDGETTGALPARVHEWPGEQGTFEAIEVRRRFTRAERDVAEFVQKHGGIFVP